MTHDTDHDAADAYPSWQPCTCHPVLVAPSDAPAELRECVATWNVAARELVDTRLWIHRFAASATDMTLECTDAETQSKMPSLWQRVDAVVAGLDARAELLALQAEIIRGQMEPEP